ncbi:RagB/SusD family nutrient uptake outer membrane protein [Arenibacter aquaticus]|uniref:RagB/SusD family nutrient uptake outer membrane protein n=1 Tax=Arenibacter aquaticus TaxID=2489054 RepID=A0A3S0D6C6_9FLAO|nr:RagB/SusD family nutrient uptake outer membrane protein [Arenibacter aquaticus]RTE54028.1 RagB/SusD family nutrient uptake outer membrane protein [Arenibacter aquaticus]
MKKSIKIFSLLILGLAISSCDSDFLDKQPSSQLSSEGFWTTEQDAQLALTGVYSNLQSNLIAIKGERAWPPSIKPNWDALTDDAYQTFNYGFREIIDGTFSPTTGGNNGAILQLYRICYKGIQTCNFFLANIDQVENVETSKLNQWKAEASFIRAFFYYYLATTYGDVPLRLESTTLDNQELPKSTAEEVFAQIEADLIFAASNLPEAPYTNGRVVKGSANALLARTYLYQNKYGQAAAAAKEVMDEGNFQLADDYSSLFVDSGQAGNPEIIFSTIYTNAPGEVQPWGTEVMLGFWGTLKPTEQFVDSFEAIDGLPIDESPEYDPENPLENRDPRLTQIVQEGEWNPEIEQKTLSGYGLLKWTTPETRASLVQNSTEATDYVHIRYADVLLMYAEGKIEDGDIDSSVLDAINQVRARAYGVAVSDTDNYPEITTTSANELREIVRNERRYELSFEGLRYFDLKRWGIAEEVLNGFYDPQVASNRVFLPKHYKWPLPQSAIDKNNALDQNPDY